MKLFGKCPELRVIFLDKSQFITHSKIRHEWFKKGIGMQVKVKLSR